MSSCVSPSSVERATGILLVGPTEHLSTLFTLLEQSRQSRGKQVLGILTEGGEKSKDTRIPVLGKIEDIDRILQERLVHTVIITDRELPSVFVRKVFSACLRENIADTLMLSHSWSKGEKEACYHPTLDPLTVEEVMGKRGKRVDYPRIASTLHNTRVLVTGAGGSIGSELSVSICRFLPSQIILFEQDETALFYLLNDLHERFPVLKGRIFPVLGDIRDIPRVEEVFHRYKPDTVFHVAAYKHVPLLEENPREGIKTNILGTYNLAGAAVASRVSRFVMVSTDKAVYTANVMGATKNFAEELCRSFDAENKETDFISVRFGNVLGSRGSVLPLFQEQIRKGGPLTLTHPDISRYFMTITEAVSLILESTVIGKGGDVIVLDMGKALKIKTFAEELISLYGYIPNKDIDIVITGLRAGEKLHEELFSEKERVELTPCKKLYKSSSAASYSMQELKSIIQEFKDIASSEQQDADKQAVILLKRYVQWYSAGEEESGKQPVILASSFSKQSFFP